MNDLTIANKSVGIDIGTNSVKVISMQQRLGAVSIEKSGEAVIERSPSGASTPEAVLAALRKALDSVRIKKDLVVVSVSTQSAAVRTLQIPFSDVNKARAVIKFQAETHLPFAIDDVVIDFFDIKTGTKERMDVLLTAIRKQVITEELAIVRQAGIDPEVIEVDFMASCNTLNKALDTSGEGVVLIDIGASKTIVAFIREGVPLALRSFASGGDAITNSIAKELNFSFADSEQLKINSATALASMESPENARLNNAVRNALDRFSGELQRTMRFLTSQLNITGQSRVVLAGGGALLKGMPEFIRDLLGHETSVIDSLGDIRNNAGEGLAPARSATAIGLALRGLGESRFLQNFRQEELSYSRAYKRMRTSIITSFILLSAVILTYIAGLIVTKVMLNKQSASLNAEIKEVISSTIGDAPSSNDPKTLVDALRNAVDQKKLELKSFRGARFFSVLEILKGLSTKIPAQMEVELKQFRINDTDNTSILIIEGSAKTKDDIVRLENILKESGNLLSVKAEGSISQDNRNRYTFKFRAEIKETQ